MKKFTRTIENFICEHCGMKVIGDGYTNHCPNCLWSKHVDVNPGDRMEKCKGLMEPINFELKNGKYTIISKCLACGIVKKNKLLDSDNLTVLTKISESIAKKTFF